MCVGFMLWIISIALLILRVVSHLDFPSTAVVTPAGSEDRRSVVEIISEEDSMPHTPLTPERPEVGYADSEDSTSGDDNPVKLYRTTEGVHDRGETPVFPVPNRMTAV